MRNCIRNGPSGFHLTIHPSDRYVRSLHGCKARGSCSFIVSAIAGMQSVMAGNRWQLHQTAAGNTLELQCRPSKPLAAVPSPADEETRLDEP